MKIQRYYILVLIINFISSITFSTVQIERPMVIVTCSYNNKDWYQRNLDSIFSQKYSNYRLIYIDDCSTDGTCELVKTYIQQNGQQNRVTIIPNAVRRKALANLYTAIHTCKDYEIVVIVDGDDWLAFDGVLAYLNNVYADPNVWLTYGQFKEYPTGRRGFCQLMPEHIIRNNAFRDFPNTPSHLRTFYAGLFKKIKKEDFLYHDGDFFPMTYDLAMMFPMLEMAREHFKFIPEILLEYNASNPINDHKVSKGLQRQIDLIIRSKIRYDKIESPF